MKTFDMLEAAVQKYDKMVEDVDLPEPFGYTYSCISAQPAHIAEGFVYFVMAVRIFYLFSLSATQNSFSLFKAEFIFLMDILVCRKLIRSFISFLTVLSALVMAEFSDFLAVLIAAKDVTHPKVNRTYNFLFFFFPFF